MGPGCEHKARAVGQRQDRERGQVGKCHGENDPSPENSSEGPAEGTRAAEAFSPSSSPCCRPRPTDALGAVPGKEQPPGTATPVRPGCERPCVPLRGRQAPARRHPGSPDGSLRSPGPAAARLAPAPRPHAHAGKVNNRMTANEV